MAGCGLPPEVEHWGACPVDRLWSMLERALEAAEREAARADRLQRERDEWRRRAIRASAQGSR